MRPGKVLQPQYAIDIGGVVAVGQEEEPQDMFNLAFDDH